jgi:hypothetical protein
MIYNKQPLTNQQTQKQNQNRHNQQMGTYQSTLAPTKIPAAKSFAVSAVQHSISILCGPTWAYVSDRVGGEFYCACFFCFCFGGWVDGFGWVCFAYKCSTPNPHTLHTGPRHRTLWLLGMIAVGCIAAPALFPLAAEGGIGGAFAYAVLMGLCLVRVWLRVFVC